MNSNYNMQKDIFVKQRAQQELFIKSNLDYENRLRGHMYQFEENENNKGNSIKKIQINKAGKGGMDNNSNQDKNEIK